MTRWLPSISMRNSFLSQAHVSIQSRHCSRFNPVQFTYVVSASVSALAAEAVIAARCRFRFNCYTPVGGCASPTRSCESCCCTAAVTAAVQLFSPRSEKLPKATKSYPSLALQAMGMGPCICGKAVPTPMPMPSTLCHQITSRATNRRNPLGTTGCIVAGRAGCMSSASHICSHR